MYLNDAKSVGRGDMVRKMESVEKVSEANIANNNVEVASKHKAIAKGKCEEGKRKGRVLQSRIFESLICSKTSGQTAAWHFLYSSMASGLR